jgi:hypothetical protein
VSETTWKEQLTPARRAEMLHLRDIDQHDYHSLLTLRSFITHIHSQLGSRLKFNAGATASEAVKLLAFCEELDLIVARLRPFAQRKI